MALRTGHGRGKGKPRIEVLPPDELPQLPSVGSAPMDRHPNGTFAPGNQASTKPRRRVTRRVGIRAKDPLYRKLQDAEQDWASTRKAELAQFFGAISAEVGDLIDTAAELMTDSRFERVKADETGDHARRKTAMQLAAEAKSHRLAAWEIASREAKARAPAPWAPPVLPPLAKSNRVEEHAFEVEPDPFRAPDQCHEDARGRADASAPRPTPHADRESPSTANVVTRVTSAIPAPEPVRQTELRNAPLTVADVLPLALLPWARDIARIVDLSNVRPDGWAQAFRDACTWLHRRGKGPTGELIAQLDRFGPDGRIGWAPRRTA